MRRFLSIAAAAAAACAMASTSSSGSVVSAAPTPLPAGFIFGTATAAYQIEGAWDVDNKQPSEWDLFSHLPGKIENGDNGDVADDSYRQWQTDLELLSAMGVSAYRFSLSWGRIIDADGNVNPLGVAHYNAIIDGLIARNIVPFVTMYHWDLPLQYGTMMGDIGRGWLNATYITPLYVRYADAVFSAFGDRVKNWIIFNEPHSFCVQGFARGTLAPGRCSDRSFCDAGDSTTEPYLCTHSVLLTYAAVANLYRSTYEPRFGPAKLGMALDASHSEPYTSAPADQAAAERVMTWALGWYAHPLFDPSHDYPQVMKDNVGSRLPVFSASDKAALASAVPTHFFFNHYTSAYAFDQTNSTVPFEADIQAGTTAISSTGQLIGPQAASSWLNVVPWGFPLALGWIQRNYGQVPIFITENGVDVPGESEMPLEQALDDQFRIDYLSQYLGNMTEVAIGEMAVNVVGYFIWSLLDNFEWANGYTCRFGLHVSRTHRMTG
jgi:beta-glucosidase